MDVRLPTVVGVETHLGLICEPDEPALPVRAGFQYRTDDPLAVYLVIRPAGDDPIVWAFARDLLEAGLTAPAGDGDVQIGPWSNPRGEFTHIRLSSPEGTALFEAHRSVVTRFLRRSFQVVPAGRETVDVDAWIPRLLAER